MKGKYLSLRNDVRNRTPNHDLIFSRRFVKTLDLVLEKHKLAAAEEKKETEAEEKDQKASLEEVIKDSFITSACIAGPLLPANRKRKQGACMSKS